MVLRKLSQTFKISIALILSVLSTGILQAVPASAFSMTNPDDEYKKVWVCKYVGTPGVNETLKKGNDGLISVPTTAIRDDDKDGIKLGDEFTDRHERSVVIAWDDKGSAPSAELCPGADSGDNDVTPLPSGINDICGPNNDTVPTADTATYKVTNDTEWANGSRTITYEAADGLVFSESEGWTVSADGKTAAYTYTDWATPCTLTPVVCNDPANGGVITQNTQGWTVKNAEFVDGGLEMSSENWSGSYIVNESEYKISEAPALNWEIEGSVSGAHGIAIIFKTESGANIHYEPVPYSDDFWTNTPGILPANAGGQGGLYSGSLQDLLDTGGDQTIVKTYFYFNSAAANTIVLKSLSFNCTEYSFDKAARVPTVCTVSNNRYIQPWTYDEVTYPEAEDYEGTGGMIANNATYEFTIEGLHLSTPDVDSSVYGLIDAGETPLQDVDKMSYDTFRKTESAGYQNTLPAYILMVDTNGTEVAGGMAYFFYEPYNNTPAVVENNWQTWDAINEGQAKWWMSGTGQTLRTWDYFVEQFPEAVVVAYGFNQGTYNAETYSIVQDIEFDCAVTTFAAPGRGSDEPKVPEVPVDNNNVQGDTTGKVLATSTTLPATLPATGDNFNPIMILITALAAYGAAYFAQGRRRVTDV